jgi:hypothetical protein
LEGKGNAIYDAEIRRQNSHNTPGAIENKDRVGSPRTGQRRCAKLLGSISRVADVPLKGPAATKDGEATSVLQQGHDKSAISATGDCFAHG